MTSSDAAKDRRIKFYVEPGTRYNLPWVVLDRGRNVVAEFDHRREAQDYVKKANSSRGSS